jgi:hypothetical protein
MDYGSIERQRHISISLSTAMAGRERQYLVRRRNVLECPGQVLLHEKRITEDLKT